jgi:hypothetical protein
MADEPIFEPVDEPPGYRVDDAYRILAGLPPAPGGGADGEAGDEPTGYSREDARRVLRGLPPLDRPVDGAP